MPKQKKRATRKRSSRKRSRRPRTIRGKAKGTIRKTKRSLKRGVHRVKRRL